MNPVIKYRKIKGDNQCHLLKNIRRILMKWITRSHVHVDRVACPWLISRFIDSEAEFLFVPKSKVLEIAEKQGAIPFDTPGAELHHRGNGCTFDAIVEDYEL